MIYNLAMHRVEIVFDEQTYETLAEDAQMLGADKAGILNRSINLLKLVAEESKKGKLAYFEAAPFDWRHPKTWPLVIRQELGLTRVKFYNVFRHELTNNSPVYKQEKYSYQR